MRVLLILLVLIATVFGCQSAIPAEVSAQPAAVIKLNPPKLDEGIPIMQALSKRQTTRDISGKQLTKQQLSEILWAADGVNRPKGERTAPSAMHRYPVDIYAVLPDGVYLYNPGRHELTLIASGDQRKQAGTQDFVYIAPLNLVYVADLDKLNPTNAPTRTTGTSESDRMVMAAIETGCQVQNVYLYCASQGLGATVRGSIDKNAFLKVINARPSQRLICGQTVGVPVGKK